MSLEGGSRIPANRLCLDFANLPFSPGDPRHYDGSWSQLIDFMAEKRIISGEKGAELKNLPESDPRAGEVLLLEAERLGEGMRAAFSAILREQRVHRQWIEPIN